MKRLLAFFGFALLLLGCAQYGSTTANNTTVQSGNAAVSISNFAFSPSALVVKVGTTVRWTNLDAAPHTITADDTSAFSSGEISQNGIFEHTFNTRGTYAYHCSIHPGMKGTINVQ